MLTITLALLAAMLVAAPTAGQDFLQDFEEFVEDMLPERAPARPNARPVPPSQPTATDERPEAAAEAEDEPDGPPLPRPRPEAVEPPGAPTRDDPDESPLVPAAVEPEAEPEPEPETESERVYQTACPALISGVVVGEMLDPIAEGICGVRSPLVITGVRIDGREIGFSSPVTTNCQMAGALADWVDEVDAYARAALESPIATLNTGTSMMCRNRYSAADGFVSEHGFANALDVTGFTLDNGETIAVEADWLPATAPQGRLLRQAHGAACGRFTTVLGPEANADHEDHFHLDLGCHGQSCMAQICE